jgi:hypothetical protein
MEGGALMEDELGFELISAPSPKLLESDAACEARWAALSAERGGVASFAAPDEATLRLLACCGVGKADRRAAWVAWCGGGGVAEAAERAAAYERALADEPASDGDRAQIALLG